MTIAELLEGRTVTPSRFDSLTAALDLGASDELLELIRDSRLVSRKDTVLLPQHRYEGLSRGKGWARKGSHDTATWGEREANGYRVGPGKWTVGGNDGFSRKGEDKWTVEHVQVGDQTWTVAN